MKTKIKNLCCFCVFWIQKKKFWNRKSQVFFVGNFYLLIVYNIFAKLYQFSNLEWYVNEGIFCVEPQTPM
jgi:hypothetical protein